MSVVVRVTRAWRLVLANYAFRALAAILGARAVVDWIAPAVASLPGGDRDLFAHGSAHLVESGLRALPRLGGVATTEALVLVAVAVLGVFPFAALLDALARADARDDGIGARAMTAVILGAKLALLLGLAAIVEVVFLALALFAASRIEHPGASPTDLASALGLAMVGVVPWWLTVTIHDLARVGVVARRAPVIDAIGGAILIAWRRPLAVIGASLLASVASLLLAMLGFGAAAWLGLGTTGAIVGVLIVQQLVIVATVTTRAAYYARLIAIDGPAESIPRRTAPLRTPRRTTSRPAAPRDSTATEERADEEAAI